MSSMKLHRDLGLSQKAAWFMLQRIREAFRSDVVVEFEGPVEVDEAYFGGLEKNKHASRKANLGRGPVGKAAAVGMKDRNMGQIAGHVVERTDKVMLQGFVDAHAALGAQLYTDDTST